VSPALGVPGGVPHSHPVVVGARHSGHLHDHLPFRNHLRHEGCHQGVLHLHVPLVRRLDKSLSVSSVASGTFKLVARKKSEQSVQEVVNGTGILDGRGGSTPTRSRVFAMPEPATEVRYSRGPTSCRVGTMSSTLAAPCVLASWNTFWPSLYI